MFCLALIAAAASTAFSYYPVDAVVAETSSPVFALPENGTVVASVSSDGFPYLPPGSVVSSASSAAFDFGADAPDIVLQGLFAGVGTVERTASGYLVSLTDDLPVSAVRIPDNLGSVTIDLCGHDLFGINGADGEDALPGGNGEPAILIVASGALGAPTVLTVVDSRPDDGIDVFGGKGGKGNPPGSDAAGIEIAADVQEGVAVDVDESVGVSQGQESPNPSCTVYVSDSGKTLGEEDPDLAQGFTVRTTGGISADDFAGYCRRTPGEAPGVYAINFVCTRMPEGLTAPFAVVPGTFTIAARPGPDAATGSVTAPSAAKDSDFLKENATASWKATSDSGCVFAGWMWAGEGAEPAAFAALSANERRNPSLSFKVAAGEKVRPGDLVPTWARIDEDAIVSVNLDTSALAVGTKSYVTATVSGLPNGFKFEAKSLRIVRDAKKALKDGGYTVKATVRNASGYSEVRTYALTVVAGEVAGIVEAAAPVATGVPVMLWCDAAKGSVKGTGVVAAGKRVSISATAKSGYVFAGWYADPGFSEPYAFADGKDYREASQAVAPVESLYLFARFVEKTTKADPIVWLRYPGDVWLVNVGIPADSPQVRFASLSKPTVKVSGLPSGVKFDASTSRFTGVPKKVGSYRIEITVNNASGSTDVLHSSVQVVDVAQYEHTRADLSARVNELADSQSRPCVIVVSDSGKTLGEEDPDLAQGFTVRTTGGISADDFAGYCRRTPGEAPGAYAINFVCTRMPAGLEAPFAVVPGTFTIAARPGPDAATGSVKAPSAAKDSDSLRENASASWKATADSGCVFAGWTWAGEGPEPAAFAALSANERRNPSLSFKVAAGEKVRPGDLVPTWVRIDEDAIVSVNLDTSALAVGTKSYVTATVSGLPNGFKFEANSLRIVRDAKKALKDGGYTVKATVKNASGYSEVRTYALTVVAGEVTGIVEAAAPVATGVPVMLWCDTAKGSVKGTGVVAAGKRVSVSATAKSGYVFAGWYADPGFSEPYAFADGKDYREASQAVAPVESLYLFARFVEKTTKADPIVWLRYAGCSAAGSFAREDTWYQGVDLPSDCCGVLFGSLSKPTVKASGLPSGVKFDASTLRFTGTPTKAGTFDVKVDVKNACGSTDVLVIRVSVVALPAWTIGTFDGGGEEGIVSLTVGSTGKISGKWQTCAKAWTLSAPSFASFDGFANAYRAVLSARSGKETMEIEVIWTESGAMAKDFSAWRNTWKQEPLKSLAAELKGRTFSDENISFKIGANGTVSAQGVFSNGYKATCSSVLVPVEGQAGCFDIALCFPAVKGKFDGLSGVWRFVSD